MIIIIRITEKTTKTKTPVDGLCNSYTMVCPSAHGDNPQALVSNYGITILYYPHQCSGAQWLSDRVLDLRPRG